MGKWTGRLGDTAKGVAGLLGGGARGDWDARADGEGNGEGP